jgi:hypothetical protein
LPPSYWPNSNVAVSPAATVGAVSNDRNSESTGNPSGESATPVPSTGTSAPDRSTLSTSVVVSNAHSSTVTDWSPTFSTVNPSVFDSSVCVATRPIRAASPDCPTSLPGSASASGFVATILPLAPTATSLSALSITAASPCPVGVSSRAHSPPDRSNTAPLSPTAYPSPSVTSMSRSVGSPTFSGTHCGVPSASGL